MRKLEKGTIKPSVTSIMMIELGLKLIFQHSNYMFSHCVMNTLTLEEHGAMEVFVNNTSLLKQLSK
jgi:hypothetical protein